MQSNPFLTILKVLAFAALAFLVGVSSCQKENLEEKVSALTRSVQSMEREIREIGRKVEGGVGVAAPRTADSVQDRRAALDTGADPTKPVGTPGRYRDLLSEDPFTEVAPEAKEHDKGTLSWWLGPEPKGFNFITENDGSTSDLIENYVADSPARRQYANPSTFKPRLCWRIEASPDFTEYTLFFRKDAVWHAPVVDLAKHPHLAGRHPVTARDAKFTLDIILNPQTDCAPTRNYYSDISKIDLIDDHTLVVRWSKTLFHSLASLLELSVMPEFLYAYGADGRRFPESTIGQSFNDHFYNRVGFCGCGPYAFVSYEKGQRIVLERFEDWYGIKDGLRYALQTHRLLIFPDIGTSLLKIKAGEIDVGGLNSPQWKSEILDNRDPSSPFNDGRILHWVSPTPRYLYFGWKNSHVLFKDRSVRKALALACNRERICHDIFLDRYRPMSSPVYPESAEADPDLKPLPYDPDGAKRLLDEAGWRLNSKTGLREKEIGGEMRPFSFTLLWPGPAPDFESALNQYKNDLLAIGIQMEPKSMEWAAYQKRLQDRQFEACSLLWATSGWEHDFDQIWHSRGIQDPGSSNHIEFSDPQVDELSDRLRETMDPAARIDMVRRIGRILYDEQPYCFFGWQNAFSVRWKHMRGVEEHQYKTRPFRRAFPMWDAR